MRGNSGEGRQPSPPPTSIIPPDLLELCWGLYTEQVQEEASRREASATLRGFADTLRDRVREANLRVRCNFSIPGTGLSVNIAVYPKGMRRVSASGKGLEGGRKLAIRVMEREMYCRNDFAEVGASRAMTR